MRCIFLKFSQWKVNKKIGLQMVNHLSYFFFFFLSGCLKCMLVLVALKATTAVYFCQLRCIVENAVHSYIWGHSHFFHIHICKTCFEKWYPYVCAMQELQFCRSVLVSLLFGLVIQKLNILMKDHVLTECQSFTSKAQFCWKRSFKGLYFA